MLMVTAGSRLSNSVCQIFNLIMSKFFGSQQVLNYEK